MRRMACIAIGVGAAAWSVAAVLAMVSSVSAELSGVATPWLLIALAIGVTATLFVMIERSREQALRVIHAELEGEVTERHLSVI